MNLLNRIVNFCLNKLTLGIGLLAGFQVVLRLLNLRVSRPYPHQFAKFLDHEWRMRYRNPSETLGRFGFRPGMTVLELGCGAGTFTGEIARMVGPEGSVHAVDLQEPMLSKTRARLLYEGCLDQVHLHCCGAYNLPFETDKFDLVIMIATLSEIPDKMQALGEIRRVLKPNAQLAISEELLDPSYVLPSSNRFRTEEAGFEYSGKSGSLFCYTLMLINLK